MKLNKDEEKEFVDFLKKLNEKLEKLVEKHEEEEDRCFMVEDGDFLQDQLDKVHKMVPKIVDVLKTDYPHIGAAALMMCIMSYMLSIQVTEDEFMDFMKAQWKKHQNSSLADLIRKRIDEIEKKKEK